MAVSNELPSYYITSTYILRSPDSRSIRIFFLVVRLILSIKLAFFRFSADGAWHGYKPFGDSAKFDKSAVHIVISDIMYGTYYTGFYPDFSSFASQPLSERTIVSNFQSKRLIEIIIYE